MAKTDIGKFILEDISSFSKESKTFGFGYNDRMFGQLVGKIAFCRIRLKLGKYVPDSGQEHMAYSDNRFLVPSASLKAIPHN